MTNQGRDSLTIWRLSLDRPFKPILVDRPRIPVPELHFEWTVEDNKSPIEYSEGIGMQDFTQGVKLVKYNCTAEYSTGPFSCLQGYFLLDRQVGYYIFWAFLPAGTVSFNFHKIRLRSKIILKQHDKLCAFWYLGWVSGSSSQWRPHESLSVSQPFLQSR